MKQTKFCGVSLVHVTGCLTVRLRLVLIIVLFFGLLFNLKTLLSSSEAAAFTPLSQADAINHRLPRSFLSLRIPRCTNRPPPPSPRTAAFIWGCG